MRKRAWGVILCLLANPCLANGLWIRAPSEATEHTTSGFSPDFLLLKLGAFSGDGFFSPKWNSSQLEALCRKKAKAGAWVTHRLSADEILSPKAGTKLARNLNLKLSGSCFFQVELDIEPLRSAPPWLATFLRSVRTELKQDYRLSLAIPPVYEKPVSGFSWKSEEAKFILEEVDGLDPMNYDTGCNTRQCYLEVLQSVFAFARSVVEQTPKKSVLFGFPVYKDRTKKHRLEIENLGHVLLALQNIKEPKFLCTERIRFAYYAGWTMDREDGENMLRIQKWRENVCKN